MSTREKCGARTYYIKKKLTVITRNFAGKIDETELPNYSKTSAVHEHSCSFRFMTKQVEDFLQEATLTI